jgi:LCP family protein required for cell wall assembly
MSARRKLLIFPIAGVIAGLLWTAVGTFQAASGQTQKIVINRAHKGEHAPDYKGTIFILMLGGDARNGNPTDVRTDSIHIVAINPVTHKASILGIPRDTYVTIPGHGKAKINEAEHDGGPSLAIQTVENLTACHFNYYTLLSFRNFVRIVNEFGGIQFTSPESIHESCCSHANFNKGQHYDLNGEQALSYARNRHNRQAGDFDRSLAQGRLIIAALAQQRSNSSNDPGTLLRALGAMYRNLHLNIPITEAVKLGLTALKIKPSSVINEVMSGGTATVNGASIVTISAKGRNQFVDICGDGQLEN